MTFGAPSAAWLLLLALPIVVFWLLKLKRPPLLVPSLVLWQRVLHDARVNAPFQRLKRHLLLLVQLVLLLLLVLAALEPRRAAGAAGGRTLVLLDRSASMGAREPMGATRLELAKARLRARVEALAPGEELAIIAFAESAQLVVPSTSDKRLLRQALESVAVEDLRADLAEALGIAAAMAQAARIDGVLLVSDGNLEPRVEFDLPFALVFDRVGAPASNVGISGLSARYVPGGRAALLVRVDASAGDPAARLEIRQDGRLVAEEAIVTRADRQQRFVFEVDARERTEVEARLVRAADSLAADALAADDVAFLALEPARPLAVFVAPKLAAWRDAVAAHDAVELRASPEQCDLVIADSELPGPARVVVTDGVVPAAVASLVVGQAEGAAVVDWRRDCALLEHAELRELAILEGFAWASDEREAALEALGYEVVVHGVKGPLVLQRLERERSTFCFLFAAERSTLPYRLAFPIVVANLLAVARQSAGLLERQAQRTGLLPEVVLAPGERRELSGPDGGRRTVQAAADGRLAALAAPLAGRYRLAAGTGPEIALGVALLDEAETRLVAHERLALSESVVAAQPAGQDERSFWRLFVMLALLVLLGEWWLFAGRGQGARA